MNVLDKNAEKYNTFSIPIEKEVKNIDKDGNESVGTTSYKIKFILLTAQDLWQIHYHIFLIILQKEFIKLNEKIMVVFWNMKVSMTIR